MDVAPVTVNETVGVLSLVGEATGVTLTTGATVSTTNVVASVLALVAASVPRTVIVWVPSVSAAGVNGEVQVAKLPVSTWHWIEVAPVTVNVTLGVLSLVGEATGVTVTTGGTVSTVNVVCLLYTSP